MTSFLGARRSGSRAPSTVRGRAWATIIASPRDEELLRRLRRCERVLWALKDPPGPRGARAGRSRATYRWPARRAATRVRARAQWVDRTQLLGTSVQRGSRQDVEARPAPPGPARGLPSTCGISPSHALRHDCTGRRAHPERGEGPSTGPERAHEGSAGGPNCWLVVGSHRDSAGWLPEGRDLAPGLSRRALRREGRRMLQRRRRGGRMRLCWVPIPLRCRSPCPVNPGRETHRARPGPTATAICASSPGTHTGSRHGASFLTRYVEHWSEGPTRARAARRPPEYR